MEDMEIWYFAENKEQWGWGWGGGAVAWIGGRKWMEEGGGGGGLGVGMCSPFFDSVTMHF